MGDKGYIVKTPSRSIMSHSTVRHGLCTITYDDPYPYLNGGPNHDLYL